MSVTRTTWPLKHDANSIFTYEQAQFFVAGGRDAYPGQMIQVYLKSSEKFQEVFLDLMSTALLSKQFLIKRVRREVFIVSVLRQ